MEAHDRPQQHKVYYRGTVQGVGFRYTTRRIAACYPVAGYVRNEPDGQVLVVVEGKQDEVQQFLAAIENEFRHYISGTQVSVGEAIDQFRTFDIRF